MNSVTKQSKSSQLKKQNSAHTLAIECVETAFFEILKTKDFNDITISEIIKKSGVSRMGFYRNFTSKEDIIQSIIFKCFDESIKEITSTRELDFSTTKIIETSLEKLLPHAEQMKLLLKNNLMSLLFECYEKAFFSLYKTNKNSPVRQYSAMMFLGELFTLEMTWVKNGLKESPKQMARIYQKLIKLKC